MDVLFTLVVIAIGGVIYFLPSLMAKGYRNAGAIFTLNLLAGWTFIGWVIAIVWAVKVRGEARAAAQAEYALTEENEAI